MTKVCPRSWEVEAVRDARIAGKDSDSLCRHLQTCEECSEQARKLEALAQDLRALPELGADALSVRRRRQHLLAAVQVTTLRTRTRTQSQSLRRYLAIAALVVFTVVVSLVIDRATREGSNKGLAPIVDIVAKAGARFTDRRTSELERIELIDGEVLLKIHRNSPLQRVVIVLPDGEIEDLGTVLSVEVSEHVTRRISVREGSVRLQLLGQAEVKLSAGDSWTRQAAWVGEVAPAAGSSQPTEQRAARPASSSAETKRVTPQAKRQPRDAHESTAPLAASAGAAKFADPVTPTSSRASVDRAEDEAYLEIVTLLERGQSGQARAAAKAYLLRFPNGFRRIEVLNVATH